MISNLSLNDDNLTCCPQHDSDQRFAIWSHFDVATVARFVPCFRYDIRGVTIGICQSLISVCLGSLLYDASKHSDVHVGEDDNNNNNTSLNEKLLSTKRIAQ